ncbi:MAG TPA: choice-of-anchor D domain-containing protein [Patescibacteria group bacterium]|nr:choice-of-anchor D domain-containing protein [Patescibacteria group bacterium]
MRITARAVCVVFAIGSAHAGTIANRVLGQPDFLHRSANTVDASSLALNEFENLHIPVAVDLAGHLYVGDAPNNRVLGWHSVSALVTGEPADLVVGQPDFETTAGAAGNSASTLVNPRGLGVDTAGNLYVADTGDSRVLIFASPFTTMAQTGQIAGFAASVVIGQVGNFTSSGCNVSGGPSPDTLCSPEDVAVDGAGNLYIADTGNNRVVEYSGPVTSSPIGADHVFGQLGNFFNGGANVGGSVSKDGLKDPTGLALDQHNNLYVADLGNNRVLEFNTPLTVTGIAGSGDTSADEVWGQGGSLTTGTCNKGGVSATSLCTPIKVALDGSANLYIGDAGNNRVLEFNEGANPPNNQTANLFIGQNSASGNSQNQNGMPNASTLSFSSGVALDAKGDLFVADGNNNRVLKYVAPLSTDQAATVALGQPDFSHTGEVIDPASLNMPQQLAIDPTTGGIVVADSFNNRVLGWRHAATFTNDQPADLVIGQPDFYSAQLNRTGGSPSANSLATPRGVAFDSAGNLYIGDFNNSRVVEYNTPFAACAGVFPCVGGNANLIFGQPSATTSSCDGLSDPTATNLCLPTQVAVDQFGNLYVADSGNNRVLEYNTPLTSTIVPGSNDTTADLVIGQGPSGTGAAFTTGACNQNAGALTVDTMCNPLGVAVDPNNNLYISDSTNDRILEFNETVNATTAPANVSANGVFGQNNQFTKNLFLGRGANGLDNPIGISFDTAGNMYAADEANSRVIEYFTPLTVTATPGSGDTNADVLWGQGGDLESGACNSGAPFPSAATLCSPFSAIVDSAGNVYIGDEGNARITAYAPPFPPPGADVGDNSRGVLSIQPSAINFRTTRVGEHRSRTATLVNAGPVPIRIGQLSAVGDFSFVEACPIQLAPGTSCDVRITFAPVTAGRRGGTIFIGDDAHSSPHHIRLSGRADRRGAR